MSARGRNTLHADPLVNAVARVMVATHQEQCCTCGDWDGYLDDRQNFIRTADAIVRWLRAHHHVAP